MSTMPKFSYDSWLIIFLFSNTVFNVLAMLEFSFVAYMEHHYGQSAKPPTPKAGPLDPKAAVANPNAILAAQQVDPDEKDKTCPCFRALFKPKGKKQRVGAY